MKSAKLIIIMQMKQLLPTLRSYEVEMDKMVVMESLDLEDLQAGMARWELKVRKVRKVTHESRDLLDPAVEELLLLGESAQTQQELN